MDNGVFAAFCDADVRSRAACIPLAPVRRPDDGSGRGCSKYATLRGVVCTACAVISVCWLLQGCGGGGADQLDRPTEHITDPPSTPPCPSADPFCQYDPGKTIEPVKCTPGAPGCI